MTDRMHVSALRWLARDAQEALVTVTDGDFVVEAFCHPCTLSVGALLEKPLVVFGSREIERVETGGAGFEKMPAGLAYRVRGRTVDAAQRLVGVGGIQMRLDMPLPGDIGDGEPVQLVCERIDVLR